MNFTRISKYLVSESIENDKIKKRLFCFSHAGGSSLLFKNWSSILKNSFECYVIVLSNNDYNKILEDPLNNKTIINDIVEDILPLYIEYPCAFFGHSSGSVLSWVIAIELEKRGLPSPLRLFISASLSPCLKSLFNYNILLSNSPEDIEKSKDLLIKWNGTNHELLNNTESFNIIRSNVACHLSLNNYIIENYQNNKVKAPITLLYGNQDDINIKQNQNLNIWNDYISSNYHSFCSLKEFSGDHFYFNGDNNKTNRELLLTLIKDITNNDNKRLIESAKNIYKKWNGRSMDYPNNKCLHDLFIEQVQKTPNNIALVDPSVNIILTFERLDYLTDLLAKWLYEKAIVRPNTVTGILMERSIEFVISYIAALKAGGGYLPLEIVYPSDLLSKVLDEAKPCAVLTKDLFHHRLPDSQLSFIFKDSWWIDLEKMFGSDISLPENRIKTKPDDLAYIVMSSGTTGVPKGICCPHRGAVHSYHWRHVKYPYSDNEREACNIFFVWEILRPLLKGYPAYIIPDEIIYDPITLVDYLYTNKITRILFTPSCCQLVLDTFDQYNKIQVLQEKLQSLKIVWLCGEVVTVELSSRFVSLFPNCELLNLYSISECHDVSVGDLRKLDITESPKFAPCGRVMENVELYVFSDSMEVVPVGMAGEVYVGGPCVGIGYLNRPEQTAKRFVKHPDNNNKRLYRTGDRGKLLYDGTLEILGRCDYMVKIRGYSVVLGAVEVAISTHPDISTCVVITVGDEGTDKILVSYIVPKEWTKLPNNDEIRQYLKSQLPHYAIPSKFIPLPQLPLHDASGKLDRKKLPLPDSININEEINIIKSPITTSTEKALANIWKELLPGNLKSHQFSLEDNFFDLGGHSLLSIRLVTQIQVHFNISYTLKLLLQSPTILGISNNIELLQKGKQLEKKKNLNIDIDIILEDSIIPWATRKSGYSRLRITETSRSDVQNIFLTGSTGFLGIFLLYELLKLNTVQHIYCLVRSDSIDNAKNRLISVLQSYKLFTNDFIKERFNSCVIIILGDLSKPLLGLSNNDFIDLAGNINSIIHCGAYVNLILSYDELRNVNVYGTREILRLATTNKRDSTAVKPVHYISTNSVFPWSNGKIIKENDSIKDVNINDLEDGYSQTKWAAEMLCMEARKRGLPIAIYRPGNLSGAITNGCSNKNDFIFLLLQGIRILDCSININNDVSNWKFDLTPVDWAAKCITNLTVKFPKYSLGDCLHIQSPHKALTSSFIFSHLSSLTSKTKDFKDWQLLLAKAIQNDKDDLLSSDGIILQKLASSLDSTIGYISNSIIFSCDRLCYKIETIAKKKKEDLSCPEITCDVITKYFSEQ